MLYVHVTFVGACCRCARSHPGEPPYAPYSKRVPYPRRNSYNGSHRNCGISKARIAPTAPWNYTVSAVRSPVSRCCRHFEHAGNTAKWVVNTIGAYQQYQSLKARFTCVSIRESRPLGALTKLRSMMRQQRLFTRYAPQYMVFVTSNESYSRDQNQNIPIKININ